MKRVREIYSTERNRRVVIYQRHDDSFSFVEEYWSNDPHEQCWVFGTWPDSICDSVETAIKEASGRIEWLGCVPLENSQETSVVVD